MAAQDVFGIVGTTQAGNFHVERVVAEGGFGVVYRAQHGAFRAPVALKCLKIPEEMTKQQRGLFLEKFREEAELMFRLSAAIAEIVRPLHVDVLQLADGRFVPFLALEWLDGESLDAIITRRRESGQAPLGLHKVVKMLRPVASALSRAHRFPGPQGAIAIIHRDLKPENIIVANIGGSESMKILDFGIAKAKRAASQAVGRATGRSIAEDVAASFTPAYGAPEQWSPKTYGETGPWTDVWGLALTAAEALCGAPLIDGDTWVMRKQALDEKRRPTPRNHGADVPIEVEKVFEKALAVDPRKRFKDIEGFWTELELALGLEPSLRKGDARREPDRPAPAPETVEPPLVTTGARLARIDLAKQAVPASQVEAAKSEASRRAGAAAKADASVADGAASGGKLRAPPEPKSGAPVSVAVESPRVKQAPVADEDWSSLGLGSEPAKLAPAAAKAPPIRRASVGLELPLPTRSEPEVAAAKPRAAERRSSSSSDLEASLPTHEGGAPGLASGDRPATRNQEADLEASLPMRDLVSPVTRRSTADLEASLPTVDAPRPEPSAPGRGEAFHDGASSGAKPRAAAEPARHPSGELELNLGGEVSPPPSSDRARSFDRGFELHAPPSRPAGLPSLGSSGGLGGLGGVEPMPSRRPMDERHSSAAPAWKREPLTLPVAILLGALALALVDFLVVKATGNSLGIGPVRVTWVAAPAVFVGVGLLLWRLIGVHGDE
jgi:serine/threonine-protein kinase